MPGTQHEVTLRFLAEPTDVNYGGKVHGGAVMKWIDQAGYAAAVAWSGHCCVTVAVGGIRETTRLLALRRHFEIDLPTLDDVPLRAFLFLLAVNATYR